MSEFLISRFKISTLWWFLDCLKTQSAVESLTCCGVVAVKVLWEVQTLCLLPKMFYICGMYLSCPCCEKRNKCKICIYISKLYRDMQRRVSLTKLHDVSACDVHITKSICPQQAVRTSLQEVSFVVRQVF